MPINFSSLSGGTSFTILASSGGTKTATLDKSYPAGTYLIESKANDTNLEIYLGATDGSQVGYASAGAKSITASASFLYVTTINADANDAIIFTLKTASTLATKTDAVWAPPTITDITPSGLPNVNDTTTITGTNFATNVNVKFRKSDDLTLVNAKTVVRGSATSIIASRPDTFSPTDAPYDVIVTNPSTELSATSLNSITAGAVPVWVTSTTLNSATLTQAFSQTIQATDSDGGSSITYAIVSGALQTGLSLNSSTGVISGTPTGSSGTTTVTISATDSGGNAVNRTFTQSIASAGASVEYMVLAGGGGGGVDYAGGGGAGGYRTNFGGTPILLNNGTTYSIQVGGGGYAGNRSNGGNGGSGGVSGIYNGATAIIESAGGGYGAQYWATGGDGGSGGGGGGGYGTEVYNNGGSGNTPATTPSQGNNGGKGYGPNGYGSNRYGGGGGSPVAAGTDSTSSSPGVGASGISNSISGSAITYARGGDGCTSQGAGPTRGTTANRGEGGSGGGENIQGTAGSSGIVVIKAPVQASSTTGSPSNPSTGVYIFSGNGSITF